MGKRVSGGFLRTEGKSILGLSPNLSYVDRGSGVILAIFYAITQDRDDIVRFLLENGADLLIVNNKGQTACSMAVSHLHPETCQLMYQKEFEQIQSREFRNFRVSHNDNERYGDLDPRFEIDEFNAGDDILAAVEEFRLNFHSMIESGDKIPSYKCLPTSFQPRSLRPTTKEFRECRAMKFRQKKSKEARKFENKLPPASKILETLDDATEEGKQENVSAEINLVDGDAPKQVVEKDNEVPSKNLPKLCLRNLLVDETSQGLRAVLVDNDTALQAFTEEVSSTLLLAKEFSASGEEGMEQNDYQLVELSWGLDCEWKPSRDRGREYPVATLQLSSLKRAFVIDLQQLCQPGVKDGDIVMTENEKKLNGILQKLFTEPCIPIIGFGVGGDITKLAVSFPHLPCFQLIHAVVDLDAVFHNCFPPSRNRDLRSLQRSVKFLLQKFLDKTEQCSNWQQRPLSDAQIEYAALDAAVLPRLLKKTLSSFKNNNPSSKVGCFSRHPHLLTSWRTTLLDHQHVESSIAPRSAYDVEQGTIRNLLSLWYVRQTWQTTKEMPSVVVPIPLDIQRAAHIEVKEERAHEPKEKTKAQRKAKRTKKSLNLASLAVDTLPTPGNYLGYTKENCILELLASSVLETLEGGCYLGFNRRGGIVKLDNAYLLFVSFGSGSRHGKFAKKFSNKFTGHGRYMTFSIDPRKDLDGLFYDFVSVGYHGQETPKLPVSSRLLLFARPDTGSQYLFCGQCHCIGEEAVGGNIDLLLQLLNFDSLESTPYMDMVGKSA